MPSSAYKKKHKKKKKKKPSSWKKDRISDLPDPILCHILSFLPTKFAATTSVLSKRWKPLWLSVQTIDFDYKTFPNLVTLLSIMNSTIFLRDITLPIHSFRFKWNGDYYCFQTDVNEIVNFVLQRRIPNFYLCPSKYYCYGNYIELPVTILSCRTLKVLKLTNITVGDISHNKDIHLPILESFHFKNVRFVCDDNLEKLLLACPILQDLVMKNSSPSEDHYSKTKFKALPNLIKARICEYYIPMTMISKAKILRLDLKTVPFTAPEFDRMFQPSPMFESLTHLEINFKDITYWNLHIRWIWLLRRLKYFPKLQNIVIQDTQDVEDMNKKLFGGVLLNVPECLSSQLKTCCIRGYKGTEEDLIFAKYIIRNSKVLETMIINSISSIDINVKHQVELSSCTKGSATCNLIFD